jgi:hypothetical protein
MSKWVAGLSVRVLTENTKSNIILLFLSIEVQGSFQAKELRISNIGTAITAINICW